MKLSAILQWLNDNKEWLFSGIATVLMASIVGFFLRKRSKSRIESKNNYESKPKTNQFKFTKIAYASIKKFNYTQSKIIRLLKNEFQRHPLLTTTKSYESLPVSIGSGKTAILTKSYSVYTVEDIRENLGILDLHKTWNKLRDSYFAAYRLKFREEQKVLANKAEYMRTEKIITQMILALSEFYHAACDIGHIDIDFIARLHNQKNKATILLGKAEGCYSNFITKSKSIETLGEVAVNLEMVISTIHKTIVESIDIPKLIDK